MSCIKASSAVFHEIPQNAEFYRGLLTLVHKALALVTLISRPALRLTRDFPDSVHHTQLDLSK